MNIVKVTKLNEDGSVAFEGVFPPDEARLILEVGVNLLLSQGFLSGMEEENEDEEADTEEFLDAMEEKNKSRLQ